MIVTLFWSFKVTEMIILSGCLFLDCLEQTFRFSQWCTSGIKCHPLLYLLNSLSQRLSPSSTKQRSELFYSIPGFSPLRSNDAVWRVFEWSGRERIHVSIVWLWLQGLPIDFCLTAMDSVRGQVVLLWGLYQNTKKRSMFLWPCEQKLNVEKVVRTCRECWEVALFRLQTSARIWGTDGYGGPTRLRSQSITGWARAECEL